MATKRCVNTLIRHRPYLFSSNASLQNIITTNESLALLSPTAEADNHHLQLKNPNSSNLSDSFHRNFGSLCFSQSKSHRHFSSERRNHGKQSENEEEEDDEDEDDEDDDDEEGELSEDSEGEEEEVGNNVSESNRVVHRTYSLEEKEKEAADIGYKVIGPLDPTERPFKPFEPVYAVVQIGSHQFKVSNGDAIYTERLKFCEVNDKLVLSKVLMVGSKSQTIIGRPILPEATVYAVVEEHALDAKVIIFKKKRRKNYRRTKGHRQELTRLRITEIQGVEKPEKEAVAA